MDMDTRKRQKAEKRYNISKPPPLEYVCGKILELVQDARKIEISTLDKNKAYNYIKLIHNNLII